MKGLGSGKSEAPGPPLRVRDGRVTLILRVQPGAARTEWNGIHDGSALKLRLAAPAVDGKANRACVRFLAREFGVAASRVSLVRGPRARTKTVTIDNVHPERWEAFQIQWQSL